MKKMPFERPTNYYEEHLYPIDEQICALLKQRKERSVKQPALPSDEIISYLAAKYDFYEDYLSSLFGTLKMENLFKPRVEPFGFRKHLPVLQSVELDEQLYSVTFIRQFENASVVNLNIDWDGTNDLPHELDHNNFELSVGEPYDCRMESGGGSTGYYHYNYIVSPPLPDDFSGMDLVFTEYRDHFREEPTGVEFVLHL
ncbi:hypothetical protein DVB69_00090 [Sporosarcina sp. BI001-red]|uniref:hypothetical protein n=1 Tax=Sporosarcina sp. BI001-red TaxID=2282866 RepID=UPI000E278D69|nr:hypothetical protein [Sporosarcina sp. BI001-red]REB11581.1 hypothetical protein DVB69_00090 [Sporosarcina sp. BI001-red]